MKIFLKEQFLLACVCLFFWQNSYAQSTYSVSLGNSITRYDFTTSKGIPLDYLKRGSGNVFQIGYQKFLIDTLNYSGQTNAKALYFARNPKMAKILSKIGIEGKLLLNQMNAVGDVQNISFDYQTNFLGIQAGIGPQIGLGKGWSIDFKGLVSANYLLQGNQHVNTTYVDLKNDPVFNQVQVLWGYSLSLQKKITDQLGIFFTQSSASTNKSIVAGQSTLNFSNQTWQFGIKITSIK